MITDKQKAFVDEYLIDLNATRAYMTVYKSCKKTETARVNGSRLLTNANVQAYLAERQLERQQRTEVTQDRVVEELAAIAFANIADFGAIEGGAVVVRDTADVPEHKQAAITSMKRGQFGIEIKLHDKVKALELLGRHVGMFKDKLEVSGEITNPFAGLSKEELLKIAGVDDG